MMNQQQGQDNVYGLNVNRAGEMSKLAKTIMNLHILFVLAYFITGVLSIVRGLTRTEAPVYGEAQGGGMGQDSTMSDILNGLLSIGGAILMFFVVRMAIQGDNRDCIIFALFCDGCCAACNCCLVILMMLTIAGLMFGKAVLNVELCECSSDFTTQCDYANTQADACSDCFDKPKCIQDIQGFHDSFGGFFVMVLVYSILVIAQMVCCIVAAVNLSKASNKMRSFPFCVAAPINMQQGMQQGVIVGQPVQGMVIGVAK